ncbi:PP2C family protein-serine/threonine phosphatase [Kitasatospora sp. NPDC048296]|uniref:PP2C family protein-serine/threonine phosphatase n=1 Tax=Kitasatospora sp. NPDC048296 TaxID=3364048 RepID=UPI0037118FDF
MPTHATAQHIGTRSHQCDATATRSTGDGGRAFVLLDGIGSSDDVRSWTRSEARRLADLTARTLQPHEAITQLQNEIAARAEWAPGACAVAAVTAPDQLLRVAWIGDCRAYLLHQDGHFQRLTTDHNLRAEVEATGEKASWWYRNHVTRCLGHPDAGTALEPEWTAVHDRAGTRLLLASDGCYEPIEDAARALGAELVGLDPAERAEHLVNLAISLGGEHQDNATCMVVDFPDAPQTPEANTGRILCAHGCVLLQDGCSGCDAAEDTPHPADPVTVRSPWTSRMVKRCRTCAQPPARRIHTGA